MGACVRVWSMLELLQCGVLYTVVCYCMVDDPDVPALSSSDGETLRQEALGKAHACTHLVQPRRKRLSKQESGETRVRPVRRMRRDHVCVCASVMIPVMRRGVWAVLTEVLADSRRGQVKVDIAVRVQSREASIAS